MTLTTSKFSLSSESFHGPTIVGSVIPSEDAHQSECVAPCDKRREWISGCANSRNMPNATISLMHRFTGSAGQAVVYKNGAYLITDSRYWLQANAELDQVNWSLIQAGAVDGPKDWIEWLIVKFFPPLLLYLVLIRNFYRVECMVVGSALTRG